MQSPREILYDTCQKITWKIQPSIIGQDLKSGNEGFHIPLTSALWSQSAIESVYKRKEIMTQLQRKTKAALD